MAKLIENLAESVPAWGAKVAYGEKSTLDGREFVPVAFVAFGFGGGEGSGDMPASEKTPAGRGEGSGGGGGGYSVPIGAYIGGPDGSQVLPQHGRPRRRRRAVGVRTRGSIGHDHRRESVHQRALTTGRCPGGVSSAVAPEDG